MQHKRSDYSAGFGAFWEAPEPPPLQDCFEGLFEGLLKGKVVVLKCRLILESKKGAEGVVLQKSFWSPLLEVVRSL